MNAENEIMAVCMSGGERRGIHVLDLPFADPPPLGAQSVEADRLYKQGR